VTADSDTADASSDDDSTDTMEATDAATADPVEQTSSVEDMPAPAPPPERIVEKRGPGFVPLVIGGVVAAGIGYFASVSGILPGAGGSETNTEIETALVQQSEVLAALQEQVANLGSAEAPSVDLSPVTDEIAALGTRIEETAGAIGALGDRVATLEERPVFTGEVAADAAEAAEAVAAMEEQMRAQEEEAARIAAEAEETARAAEEAIAAAEAEAQAAMAAAEAEAALERAAPCHRAKGALRRAAGRCRGSDRCPRSAQRGCR
jgi:chemotaxis protein histidine kinase CheA